MYCQRRIVNRTLRNENLSLAKKRERESRKL
jgi:hypothetical protein